VVAASAGPPAGRGDRLAAASHHLTHKPATRIRLPRATALLTVLGIRPFAWSLLAGLARDRVAACVEPRAALHRALSRPHPHTCAHAHLLALLAALGDPRSRHGWLGLTGSAALDPARLCHGGDLDLLVYPALDPARLHQAVRRCGGRFLAELANHDPRYQDYASRSLPGSPDAARRPRLWARRLDVCRLAATRVDLTEVPDRGHEASVLPYAAADLGPVQRDLRVTAVGRGYPVTLAVDRADVARTREIDIVLDVMSELGARIDWLDAHTVQVATPEVLDPSLNERYSGVNRIPILMMGPLLHRAGQASVPLPGGCRIGKRPIDFHLAGLRQMGAEVIQQPRSVARGRHGSGPPPRPQRRPRGRTAAQAHTLGEQGNASAPSAAGVAPHRPSGRPPLRRL